jgi:hypothetical protein
MQQNKCCTGQFSLYFFTLFPSVSHLFSSKLKISKNDLFRPVGILYTIFPSKLSHLTYFSLCPISGPKNITFHKFFITTSVKGKKFPEYRFHPKNPKDPFLTFMQKSTQRYSFCQFSRLSNKAVSISDFFPVNSSL